MAGISTSSLLNSANARRVKIQQQEDDLVAFEYSLSAKTYADFQTYSNYLSDRQSKAPDASSQLTYTKAIVGARKGYISNEIQRANIDLVEGRSDNRGKYGKMVNLYYQALENNDYDLAQSLNLQLDNLSVKIQLEDQSKADAAQRVASTLASNGFNNLKDMVKQLKVGLKEVTLANGKTVAPIKMIDNELKSGDFKNYFAALYDTTKAMQDLVGDAYNSADQETVNKFEQDDTLRDIINGDAKFGTATGHDGKTKSLSMQDIELAYRSAAANNPIYSVAKGVDPHTGKAAYSLKENKIDDFVWTRNDDGTYSATEARVTVSSPNQTLDTKITNEGYIVGKDKDGKDIVNTGQTDKQGNFKGTKADVKDGDTIRNRLKAQGIDANQNNDGTLDLVLPNGTQTKGTVMPDGTLRYFGEAGQYSGDQAGLYEINLLTGSTREVAPDEASDFGNESIFGGLLSQPSAAGQNYVKNLFGLNPVKEVAPVDLRHGQITTIGARPLLQAPGGIRVGNDFSGTGSAVTSRLLQGANFTSGNLLKEAQERIRQAAAAENARLQAAPTFSLNTTPVRQTASNGAPVRQLTVSRPAPQPKVTVTTKPTGVGQLGGYTGGFVDSNSGFRLQ